MVAYAQHFNFLGRGVFGKRGFICYKGNFSVLLVTLASEHFRVSCWRCASRECYLTFHLDVPVPGIGYARKGMYLRLLEGFRRSDPPEANEGEMITEEDVKMSLICVRANAVIIHCRSIHGY